MIERAPVAFALAALLAACGPTYDTAHLAPSAPLRALSAGTAGDYIKHVVIVVQENRSFDNVFAGFPGADAPTSGYGHDGRRYPLHDINFVTAPNLSHLWVAGIGDWNNGKMNGFDVYEGRPLNDPSAAYARLDRADVKPYWQMAKQYVLADHMFPTQFGESFTAHLDLIASTTQFASGQNALVDSPTKTPWGCDAPEDTATSLVTNQRVVRFGLGPFPCFKFHTIAEPLDAAGISWKYYAPAVDTPGFQGGGNLWSSFDAISAVRYGREWRNVVSPQTAVLEDIRNGKLAGVTWVIPDFWDSDHPGSGSDTGPSWVAAIVNEIGKSRFWNSTAIVVLWDDWGGYYDDVPPPQLDFEGLGIRVPCIIVSPYARRGYVSHTQYEFGSTLKFVERVFNLSPIASPSFGYTDTRANSLEDAFDFTQTPRAFVPIAAKYPPSHFLQRRPSRKAPDDD